MFNDENDATHAALVRANAMIERQSAEIATLKAQVSMGSTDAYAALEEETARLTALVMDMNDQKLKSEEDAAIASVRVGVGSVVRVQFWMSMGFVIGMVTMFVLLLMGRYL